MPEPGMCDHVLHLALGFDGGHAALNALEQLVDDTGLNPRHACTRGRKSERMSTRRRS